MNTFNIEVAQRCSDNRGPTVLGVCIQILIQSTYNHYRVDYAHTLPELFMEVADPEMPSSKGVLSSLFGSHHSVVDREELCKFIMCVRAIVLACVRACMVVCVQQDYIHD